MHLIYVVIPTVMIPALTLAGCNGILDGEAEPAQRSFDVEYSVAGDFDECAISYRDESRAIEESMEPLVDEAWRETFSVLIEADDRFFLEVSPSCQAMMQT